MAVYMSMFWKGHHKMLVQKKDLTDASFLFKHDYDL